MMKGLICLLCITGHICLSYCQVTGDLRIIGSSLENRGRLEFFKLDDWGTVCDDAFDNVDATVACRQLGYCQLNSIQNTGAINCVNYGYMVRNIYVPDGNGSILMDDVDCSGTESKLIDCSYTGNHNCRHYEDVGIHCNSICPTTGDLRLTDSALLNEGRLEIYLNNIWGTVCDYAFDDIDAGVACRQLGYCAGIPIPASYISNGYGTILLHDVGCTGTESILMNCPYVATNNCTHVKDVGIKCFSQCQPAVYGTLRLIGGNQEHVGRLEISMFNEWGSICSTLFDNRDAAVACKQLGYCTGVIIESKNIDDGNGTIWLDQIDCVGTETKLINCSENSYIIICGHENDVKLQCFTTCPSIEGQLMISSGPNEHEGRLNIYMHGIWGSVCEDLFDDIDASVACRQLGYCSGNVLSSNTVVDGSGIIWMDDLRCSGTESTLDACTYDNHTSDCSSNKDVGVNCSFACQTVVNGHWSTWSPWSACFCGSSQFRTRNSTDPAPMYGGQFCQGNVVEQITCTSFCYSNYYELDSALGIRYRYGMSYYSVTTSCT